MINFLRRLFYIVPKLPETAQISVTNRCNFNCQMCQRNDLKVSIKDMPFEKFENIVGKLFGVKNLILTGWGEPFVHKDIIKMIKFGKNKGFNIRLTSNGSLLSDDLIDEILASKLDAITFSVDEIEKTKNNIGHINASQLKNIKIFVQKREEKNSNLKIYLQSVFYKNKEENIYNIAKWAIKNNVDRVRITRLDVRFHNFERPTKKEEKKLIKNLEKITKGKTGIDFLPHIAFDGLAKIVYKIFHPFLHRFGRHCLRTYSDIYINVDGMATPCCALPRLFFGDLNKESLESIWDNKKFKYFRKNEKNYCGKCDILLVNPNN